MSEQTPRVERRLKLASAAMQQSAIALLRESEGVTRVVAEGQLALRVSYDFTRLSWAVVCEQLSRAGLYTPKRWWVRWRDGWRDQIDHNMRENLSHRAACCSQPPPGAGRR